MRKVTSPPSSLRRRRDAQQDPADGRKVKGVIHWVSAAHAPPIEIRLTHRLFSVPNPEAAEHFLAVTNRESLMINRVTASHL
ncbi:hypothetical protein ACNKHO_04085 [Shigella flexneri]